MKSDLTGTTLGPFEIERRIGQGAMGMVYEATHRTTGKKAAIKVMDQTEEKSSSTLAKRFEREIKLLSDFRHPNIVRYFGASQDKGIRYYAMELVEGRSLQDVLDGNKKLSFKRTIKYATQMCDALQAMHATGVIHRDLKPANVMISKDHRVKLTDFGIAKDITTSAQTQLTKDDHTVGTIAYMSPEQLSGRELTRKSDLYSLGIMMYRMLTGKLPFTSETMFDYINQRMSGTFPHPSTVDPNVPLEFDDLIRDMLAQDPNDRPLDAYQVMQRLLDIEKRSKMGTLLKTRPPTPDGMSETKQLSNRMSTLIKTVTDSFYRRRHRSRHESDERSSLVDSVPFLAGCLLILVAFVAYMLWPLGPDALFEKGQEIMAAEGSTYLDWEQADERYFTPLMEKYPDNPYQEKIADNRDKIMVAKARGRSNRSIKFKHVEDDASPAERQYIKARQLATDLDDPYIANEQYRAIINIFGNDPTERAWVLLATEELEDQERFESQEKQSKIKREKVAAALDEARALRDRDKLRALALFEDINKLYGNDEEVKDLIDKARDDIYGTSDESKKEKTDESSES